jgi:long-chain acyl-CoA synthetase
MSLDDPYLLHHHLLATNARLPGKVALVCDGRRHAYADLESASRDHAAGLHALGVRHGDRVLLFLDGGFDMLAAIYGVLRLGAVFVPVNPLTKRDKLQYLLADTRARAMIAHASLQGIWRETLPEAGHLLACCVVGEMPGAAPLPARCTPWPPAPGSAGGEPPEAQIIDQDLAAIIYTSGSTGDPKGVMLTHLNMVSAARSVSGYLGLRQDDVIACLLPLAFDYGLYQALMSVKVGGTLVLERSFAFPLKVLESMARERVTVLPGVPTIFAMLMNLGNLAAFDLSALRMITNTAAALPVDHIRQLRALFPGAVLFSMYGLTECKRVSFLPPEELDRRPGSVGRGMPNERVWLVDGDGRRLPNGSVGELVIQGSNVMKGYWEKPRETAERLRPGARPGEVVLYSGDIFRTDAEGWLYFVGRSDDIIKTRGEKVSPREVENAVCSMDAVREAAVVGVRDELLGEAVKAFVVLKDGRTATERDVIRHCVSRLESFMAPKYVEFVAELPRTDTGKVKKKALA